ncbi:hypothetical protein BSKO_05489 [Bryopsis sp. KO-2023]|nr:hypothetical protein BSKO_05489 [Bryopsis sp. KO-2023]
MDSAVSGFSRIHASAGGWSVGAPSEAFSVLGSVTDVGDMERMSPMTTVITLGSEIVAISHRSSDTSKSCSQLAKLINWLVAVMVKLDEAGVLTGNEDGEGLLEDLGTQLQNTRQLMERGSSMPLVYSMINAFQINSQFRNACHSIGLTLKALSLVLRSFRESSTRSLREDVKKLEARFCKAVFPLDEREMKFFTDTRKITGQISKRTISARDGILQVQQLLKEIVDVDRITDEWKQVAEQLFHDMDVAREKKDRTEEHFTRQLFQAIIGPEKPSPEFFCPISLELMDDPVVLIDTAITYEKKSIDAWLYAYGSATCPVSGKSINLTSHVHYVENKALRSLIDDWKRDHGSPRTPESSDREGALDVSHASTASEFSQGRERSDKESVSESGSAPHCHSSRPNSSNFMHSGVEDFVNGLKESPAHVGKTPRRNQQATRSVAVQNNEYDSYDRGTDPGYWTVAEPSKRGWIPEVGDEMSRTGSSAGENINMHNAIHTNTESRAPTQSIQSRMLGCCQHGDLRGLFEYEAKGWSPMYSDEGGRTCLHLAAAYNHLEIVNHLLEMGHNVDVTTEGDFATPLYMAACGGHTEITRALLRKEANVMIVNKYGWSPLHAAADQGHYEMVKDILDHALSAKLRTYVNLTTEAGWSVLHHATRSGNLKLIRLLLPLCGNHLNQQCNVGYTPLHIAADNGLDDVAELLLEAGADANVQSKDGWTALHVAQDKNNIVICRMLLRKNANPDLAGQDGVTALHRAAFQNHIEFAKILVKEGKASLNKRTMPNGRSGRKAIQIASDRNHHELHNFLFKSGLQRMFRVTDQLE